MRVYPLPREINSLETMFEKFANKSKFEKMREDHCHYDVEHNFGFIDTIVGGTIPNQFVPAVEKGCKELLERVAPQLKFNPSMLAPAPVELITYRMLSNLRRVFLEREEFERGLAVVDLLLMLAPNHPVELRTRAALLANLGAYRAALKDVERCMELSPDAPDRDRLELTARELRERAELLN